MNIDDLNQWFKNVSKVQRVAVLTRFYVQISDNSDTENSAFGWILIKIEVNLKLIKYNHYYLFFIYNLYIISSSSSSSSSDVLLVVQ